MLLSTKLTLIALCVFALGSLLNIPIQSYVLDGDTVTALVISFYADVSLIGFGMFMLNRDLKIRYGSGFVKY